MGGMFPAAPSVADFADAPDVVEGSLIAFREKVYRSYIEGAKELGSNPSERRLSFVARPAASYNRRNWPAGRAGAPRECWRAPADESVRVPRSLPNSVPATSRACRQSPR